MGIESGIDVYHRHLIDFYKSTLDRIDLEDAAANLYLSKLNLDRQNVVKTYSYEEIALLEHADRICKDMNERRSIFDLVAQDVLDRRQEEREKREGRSTQQETIEKPKRKGPRGKYVFKPTKRMVDVKDKDGNTVLDDEGNPIRRPFREPKRVYPVRRTEKVIDQKTGEVVQGNIFTEDMKDIGKIIYHNREFFDSSSNAGRINSVFGEHLPDMEDEGQRMLAGALLASDWFHHNGSSIEHPDGERGHSSHIFDENLHPLRKGEAEGIPVWSTMLRRHVEPDEKGQTQAQRHAAFHQAFDRQNIHSDLFALSSEDDKLYKYLIPLDAKINTGKPSSMHGEYEEDFKRWQGDNRDSIEDMSSKEQRKAHLDQRQKEWQDKDGSMKIPVETLDEEAYNTAYDEYASRLTEKGREAYLEDAEEALRKKHTITKDIEIPTGLGYNAYFYGLEWRPPEQRAEIMAHLAMYGGNNPERPVPHMSNALIQRNKLARKEGEWDWIERQSQLPGSVPSFTPEDEGGEYEGRGNMNDIDPSILYQVAKEEGVLGPLLNAYYSNMFGGKEYIATKRGIDEVDIPQLIKEKDADGKHTGRDVLSQPGSETQRGLLDTETFARLAHVNMKKKDALGMELGFSENIHEHPDYGPKINTSIISPDNFQSIMEEAAKRSISRSGPSRARRNRMHALLGQRGARKGISSSFNFMPESDDSGVLSTAATFWHTPFAMTGGANLDLKHAKEMMHDRYAHAEDEHGTHSFMLSTDPVRHPDDPLLWRMSHNDIHFPTVHPAGVKLLTSDELESLKRIQERAIQGGPAAQEESAAAKREREKREAAMAASGKQIADVDLDRILRRRGLLYERGPVRRGVTLKDPLWDLSRYDVRRKDHPERGQEKDKPFFTKNNFSARYATLSPKLHEDKKEQRRSGENERLMDNVLHWWGSNPNAHTDRAFNKLGETDEKTETELDMGKKTLASQARSFPGSEYGHSQHSLISNSNHFMTATKLGYHRPHHLPFYATPNDNEVKYTSSLRSPFHRTMDEHLDAIRHRDMVSAEAYLNPDYPEEEVEEQRHHKISQDIHDKTHQRIETDSDAIHDVAKRIIQQYEEQGVPVVIPDRPDLTRGNLHHIMELANSFLHVNGSEQHTTHGKAKTIDPEFERLATTRRDYLATKDEGEYVDFYGDLKTLVDWWAYHRSQEEEEEDKGGRVTSDMNDEEMANALGINWAGLEAVAGKGKGTHEIDMMKEIFQNIRDKIPHGEHRNAMFAGSLPNLLHGFSTGEYGEGEFGEGDEAKFAAEQFAETYGLPITDGDLIGNLMLNAHNTHGQGKTHRRHNPSMIEQMEHADTMFQSIHSNPGRLGRMTAWGAPEREREWKSEGMKILHPPEIPRDKGLKGRNLHPTMTALLGSKVYTKDVHKKLLRAHQAMHTVLLSNPNIERGGGQTYQGQPDFDLEGEKRYEWGMHPIDPVHPNSSNVVSSIANSAGFKRENGAIYPRNIGGVIDPMTGSIMGMQTLQQDAFVQTPNNITQSMFEDHIQDPDMRAQVMSAQPSQSTFHDIRNTGGYPVDMRKEDSWVPPVLPMHQIFTLDDLRHLKGFSGEWVVQRWPDGIHLMVSKEDDKVNAYDEDGDAYHLEDEIKEDFKKICEKSFMVDTIYNGERYHVVDLVGFQGSNVMDMRSHERLKLLRSLFTSTENIETPSPDNLREGNEDELTELVENIRTDTPVLLRDSLTVYPRGNRRHPKWVLLDPSHYLNFIVLDKKGSGYRLGVGPLVQTDGVEDVVVMREGQAYMDVGSVFRANDEYEPGDVVAVNVTRVIEKKTDGRPKFIVRGGRIVSHGIGSGITSTETLQNLSRRIKAKPKASVRKSEDSLHIAFNDIGEAIYGLDDGYIISITTEEEDLLKEEYIITLSETHRDEELQAKEEVYPSAGDAKPLIPKHKRKVADGEEVIEKPERKVPDLPEHLQIKAATTAARIMDLLLKTNVAGVVGSGGYPGPRGLGIDYATPISSPRGPTKLEHEATLPDFDFPRETGKLREEKKKKDGFYMSDDGVSIDYDEESANISL